MTHRLRFLPMTTARPAEARNRSGKGSAGNDGGLRS
jgi:hypothetical protein